MRLWIAVAVLSTLLASPALADDAAKGPVPDLALEPIQPLQAPAGLDPKKVEIGRKLFNDKRLSATDSLACSSCHVASQGGSLHQAYAIPGVSGKAVPINIPTIFGSSLNFTQFWDGRASSLEEQIDGPVTNPDEMGAKWDDVLSKLSKDAGLTSQFRAAYQDGWSANNVRDALATFERSQVPVNSPFDRYLLGNPGAISKEARDGYGLFKELGCSSCHQGQNVGGNMFQKFGVMQDYFKDRGHVIDKDFGRYNVTKNEEDRYVFKVPSLRNVELTAPYFHDGSAKTLDQAVTVMAKYQLGRDLTDKEKQELVAFLKSLTGTIPEQP